MIDQIKYVETKLLQLKRHYIYKESYRGKQCGPISDCSYRRILTWIYTVFEEASKHFNRREQQTTLVVIGALRVNKCEFSVYTVNVRTFVRLKLLIYSVPYYY